MSYLNFIKGFFQYCSNIWSAFDSPFSEDEALEDDEEEPKDECTIRRRKTSARRSKSGGGPKAKRPCNLVTAWHQMNLRHRMIVAEVCEALLDLHLSEEVPATKTDILREMEERGTKPEVRRVFQNKLPTMAEFRTAFNFAATFGLLRPEKNQSGTICYCLERRLEEVLFSCRGDFDDVIAALEFNRRSLK
ncbi:hypothetical protein GE061_007623 [Apolygus lucorum]|uniref:Uncharacterized protein n=1 Tax=Apolygus lucorum TaxID=248454 RepID=A0A6A4IZ73_APOLU|nr:hypothetical protein GE061_007623 [Apolygus lucorum]